MTPDECRFFEEHALRSHCILGSDYYLTNEHHVEPDGATSDAGETIGYAMIAREYAQRYGLPMMHTETNRDQDKGGDEASSWLRRQWAVVLSLMRCGVPVVGFTWYSLTDQIDWHIELREACGIVNPRGLYDLERRIRPVGTAYRDLIAAWDGRTGTVQP
jgi:beta-glucosidase/6-phospho-beta-glucosidase/beta-galactosidase